MTVAASTYVAIVICVLVLWHMKDLMIVKENERVAAFRLGRFIGIKGPGLLYPLKPIDRFLRLRLDTTGKATSQDTLRVDSYDIPVVFADKHELDALYRIIRFEKVDNTERVVVGRAPAGLADMRCPHCGKQFQA